MRAFDRLPMSSSVRTSARMLRVLGHRELGAALLAVARDDGRRPRGRQRGRHARRRRARRRARRQRRARGWAHGLGALTVWGEPGRWTGDRRVGRAEGVGVAEELAVRRHRARPPRHVGRGADAGEAAGVSARPVSRRLGHLAHCGALLVRVRAVAARDARERRLVLHEPAAAAAARLGELAARRLRPHGPQRVERQEARERERGHAHAQRAALGDAPSRRPSHGAHTRARCFSSQARASQGLCGPASPR